jgi:hypothetical protein
VSSFLFFLNVAKTKHDSIKNLASDICPGLINGNGLHGQPCEGHESGRDEGIG